VVATGPVRADDTGDLAKEAFEEGKRLFHDGEFEEAATAFRRAQGLKPNWKLNYNIGQSEAAAKRYGLALDAFEEYLAEGGDELPLERKDEVLTEVQRLRGMVGFLEVEGEPGDVVVVGGVSRGELPGAARVRVAMGETDVRLIRDNATILERQVEIFGGETTRVDVGDDAVPTTEASRPEEGGEDEGPERVWTWFAVGVAGAATIGAVVTGAVSTSKRNDVTDECDGKDCPASLSGDFDTVHNLAVATDVLIGVAAAGAVAGVLLYIFEPTMGSESEVTVTPTASVGGGGLAVSGRF
jgi:hypothetical protein